MVGFWVASLSAPAYAGLGTGPTIAASPVEDLFDDPKLMREMGASRIAAGGVPRVGHIPTAPTPTLPPKVASATMTRVASPRTSVPASQATATVPAKPAPVAVVPARPAPPAPAPVAVVPARPISPAPVAPAPPVRTAARAAPPPAATPPHAVTSVAPVPAQVSKPAPAAERSGPAKSPPPAKKLALADTAPVTDAAAADVSQSRKAPVEEAPVSRESASSRWPYAPRLKLGYRRFPFARASSAAPSITPGVLDPNRPESFESLSLDLYPVSWYMRMGLSSQFGWESGQFDRSGDYFFAQSFSLGFQLPGRFTPFIEGLAGAGYMRRVQGANSHPGGYWQLGVDLGVEIYFAARAYVSVAGGYLHPGNLFVDDQSLQSIKLDTWSLKVGLGI